MRTAGYLLLAGWRGHRGADSPTYYIVAGQEVLFPDNDRRRGIEPERRFKFNSE